jgi:WD40 repeat protein
VANDSHDTLNDTPSDTLNDTPSDTLNDTDDTVATRPRSNTSSLRDLVTAFESTALQLAASTQPPEKSPRRSSVKSSTLRQLSRRFEPDEQSGDLRKYLSLRHGHLDASSELSPHVTENIPLLLWSNYVTAEHVLSNDHVLVTSTSDEYVTVWDLLENSAQTFSGHSSAVTGLALASQGDQVLTASDNEVLSWRASDCHVTGHQQRRVSLVALASDGSHAVTAVDKEMTLWTGDELKLLKTVPHSAEITCLTMWPRSAGQLLFVVTGSGDRSIRLWDLATGECLTTIEDAHRGAVTALAVLSHGRHVISYSAHDQHVKVWELDNKECVLQHHVTEPCTRTLIKVVADWHAAPLHEYQWHDLLLATEVQNLKLQIGLSEQCCCILVSDEL